MKTTVCFDAVKQSDPTLKVQNTEVGVRWVGRCSVFYAGERLPAQLQWLNNILLTWNDSANRLRTPSWQQTLCKLFMISYGKPLKSCSGRTGWQDLKIMLTAMPVRRANSDATTSTWHEYKLRALLLCISPPSSNVNLFMQIHTAHYRFHCKTLLSNGQLTT